jgi:hypothetical protein
MNVPNINIKEILAKLSFLKDNLSLLVAIIIAVVALLMVVPNRLLSARLRGTVEENSIKAGRSIDTLIKDLDPETLKITSPKYVEACAQDANATEQYVEQAMKRELLSYNIFPDVNDRSRQLFERFGQEYRNGIVRMVGALDPGEAPTMTDITSALASAPRAMDSTGHGVRYDAGTLMGGAGLYGDRSGQGLFSYESLGETERKIVDQLCLGKAMSAKIYLSPTDVAGYAFWNEWSFTDRDSAYRDCWYWQLGYWIIEDVMTTLGEINQSASNVITAPVKRLMNVNFTFQRAGMSRMRAGRRGGVGRAEGERPVYVTDILKGLTTPCTARICNDSIDVVHFDVRVVVDATQIVPFMQSLCMAKAHRFYGYPRGDEPERKYEHNQITILESSVVPIEPTDIAHNLYRYGDRPVVELDLICEYVFNKTAAFEFIKPPQVKKDLEEAKSEG